jgi:hypothetical protein
VTALGHSGLKVRTRTGYLSDASSVARSGREVAK